MIYLLYGEDTYRSRKKLNEIIEEYRKKSGPYFDFERIDAESETFSKLRNTIGAGSLFSSKKMIVVENFLSSDDCLAFLKEQSAGLKENKDLFLVIWEGKLDPKTEKQISKTEDFFTKSQEFKLLGGWALEEWIYNASHERNITLLPEEHLHLLALGGNLWAITNELDKIMLIKAPLAQNKKNIFLPEKERTIFDVGDTFFSSPQTAARNLFHIFYKGGDEFNIFSYLVNHLRTLYVVKTCSEQKKQIPAELHIHPFVVKKASLVTEGLGLGELESFFNKFLEEDLSIKIGISKPKEALLRILFRQKYKST